MTNSVAAAALAVCVDANDLQSLLPVLQRMKESGERDPLKIQADKIAELEQALANAKESIHGSDELEHHLATLADRVEEMVARLRADENGKAFITRPAGHLPQDSNMYAVWGLEEYVKEIKGKLKAE